MRAAYAPPAGSVADKVLKHFAADPTPRTSTDLGELLGVQAGLSTCLNRVVAEGLLVSEKIGRCFVYSLPEPIVPSDGKLKIAMYQDGDVSIQGGVQNEDGSVLYTGDQMRDLFRVLTAPHLQLDKTTYEPRVV